MSDTFETTADELKAMRARLEQLEGAADRDDRGEAVLVTTSKRGVFFGYLADGGFGEVSVGVSPIVLVGARNCIMWTSDVGGVMGLAVTGPSAGCRIGAQVPGGLELPAADISSVTECTDVARRAWDAAATYEG